MGSCNEVARRRETLEIVTADFRTHKDILDKPAYQLLARELPEVHAVQRIKT